MNKRFPILCVDNFYESPDDVVNFALSQKFQKSKFGYHQGKRTLPLHQTNKTIFNYLCAKLFSIFYNFEKENLKWNVISNFDLNDKIDKDVGSGWIHQDDNKYLLAGLIYLNKSWEDSVGTKIYKKIKDCDESMNDCKVNYFLEKISKVEYLSTKEKYNSSFVEVANFQPVYNRMICYDSSYFHGIGDLTKLKTNRLVQVFFVEMLKTDKFPLERI